MMKKEIKKVEIFSKHYDGIRRGFLFSDLPTDILPTDIIDFVKNEGFYSDNNSWDDNSILKVYREMEETDEEFEKRKLFWEQKKEESKQMRYEEYLKLDKEFGKKTT